MAATMDKALITDGGSNSKPLFCRHCGSQFLSAEKAQHVEHTTSQEHFKGILTENASKAKKEGADATGTNTAAPIDVSSSFWKINDMWDFDNYGQTRSVAGATSDEAVTPETVYVVCADCEKGPVGVRWKAGDAYYVSHSLVTYEAKEGAPANGALPAGMSEEYLRQLIAAREAGEVQQDVVGVAAEDAEEGS